MSIPEPVAFDQKAYRRSYYLKNREAVLAAEREKRGAMTPEQREKKRAYNKAYREANRDRLLARQRERGRLAYLADPEKSKARTVRWARENPERKRTTDAAYRARNREKLKAYHAANYQANKALRAVQSRRTKLRRYGLTLEAFESLLEQQKGHCRICQTAMTAPMVDHDHKTGEVRGLLCQRCNTGIGLLQDDPAILTAAIEYLTRSSSGSTSMTNNERSSGL